ncbi:hypothetical protein RS83_03385 [Microbacterium oxydans]|uniref:Lipoprotein n=1 Tax=Microbacterium oxydans TaxID=82380 RepID=A0A0F0L6K1_9MICO|nr:hypothetical protein RS83_03385 [Microbacterium oxydans]
MHRVRPATRNRRPLREIGAALAVLVALPIGLVGCRPEIPQPQPYPSIEWESGSAPSGGLEDDPWVQATRASLEAQAVAQNQNDFNLPELIRTTGLAVRSDGVAHARSQLKNGHRTVTVAGPMPFAPIEVIADAADPAHARVQACVGASLALEASDQSSGAFGIEYRLERIPEGLIRVVGSTGLSDLECDGVEFALARFDPQPVPSTLTDARDVPFAERDDLDRQAD